MTQIAGDVPAPARVALRDLGRSVTVCKLRP